MLALLAIEGRHRAPPAPAAQSAPLRYRTLLPYASGVRRGQKSFAACDAFYV